MVEHDANAMRATVLRLDHCRQKDHVRTLLERLDVLKGTAQRSRALFRGTCHFVLLCEMVGLKPRGLCSGPQIVTWLLRLAISKLQVIVLKLRVIVLKLRDSVFNWRYDDFEASKRPIEASKWRFEIRTDVSKLRNALLNSAEPRYGT